MAFSIQITQARQSAVGLALQPAAHGQLPGTYNLVVDYCVQATLGGRLCDVLIAGMAQRVSVPVSNGKPMLSPAQVAALIRQDCQAVFGGQPDKVLIDGTVY